MQDTFSFVALSTLGQGSRACGGCGKQIKFVLNCLKCSSVQCLLNFFNIGDIYVMNTVFLERYVAVIFISEKLLHRIQCFLSHMSIIKKINLPKISAH